MASLWRRAMVYLGLQDDDEFDDYADYDYDDDGEEEPPPPQPRQVAPVPELQGAPQGPVMPRSQTEFREPAPLDTGLVRPVPRDDPPGMTPSPRPAVVRTSVSSTARVHVVEPQGFNDAQELGDRLKAGQPVMLNLRGLTRELQRRLIDFSSGLAYAVGATMQKVDDHVFLLTPTNVEVSQDEKERLRAKGLYRV